MIKRELDLEAKVIDRFVLKAKKERYLSFIQKEKTRKKFLDDFSHMNFLNEELFEKVDGDEREMIQNRIRKIRDLKDCYVISENRDIDGRRLEIKFALQETIGANLGSLLVFGDAEVVYAEAEGFNNRWISK